MISLSTLDAELAATGHERAIVSGECKTSDVKLADESGISFGVWECTPGIWKSSWAEWEAFTVLQGEGTLTDGDGNVHELGPGLLVVIPPGTTGVWNVTKTVRKTFAFPTGRKLGVIAD